MVFNRLPARAADKDAIWDKGNKWYSQKQYDSAAACYEQLLPAAESNAALHYNLANTYYRLNRVGPAILHYEKALHLQPGDVQASDNLILAKGRVQNPVPEVAPIFFVAWWNSFLQAISPNTWAWISLLVFAGILTLVYFARTRKEAFRHSGRWLSLSIVALLLCGCMAYFTYEAAHNSGKAVVLQPAANLLEAPKPSSKVISSLPEGTVLDVYTEEAGFLNVKLPNGRVGWLSVTAVEKV